MKEPSQAFAPLASSKHTLAEYKNPFGFSLQVVESAQTLTISSHGADAAQVRACRTNSRAYFMLFA